ncbi:MAG: ATP-binding protein [Proteobacteria bacterium]|nr:ATP-binding protein [Pseudomonadota bacterium]
MARDLRSILDAVFDGVIVLDEDARVEIVNGEACRILEQSAESVRGLAVEALFGADHALPRLARDVLSTGRPAVEDEVSVEPRDPPLEVDIAVSPLDAADRRAGSARDNGVSGVVVLLRDRTVARSLREIVSERERLDSYGHIAAGIAHEVKNPLGGIRGAAELLAARATDDRGRDTAGLIVREVDRITELVEDLMVFARGDKLRLEPVNLHFVLDGVLDLLALDPLAEGGPVERFYDPSIPEFLADGDRLRQVFLNLARNGLQAVEENAGSLTITTRMSLDERLVGSDGRSLPTVVVAISDTGPGIAREVLHQLSTPFFTTRPQGTGLGLAVSRHWVARHDGTLRITSQLGEGTTVRVALPLRLPKEGS